MNCRIFIELNEIFFISRRRLSDAYVLLLYMLYVIKTISLWSTRVHVYKCLLYICLLFHIIFTILDAFQMNACACASAHDHSNGISVIYKREKNGLVRHKCTTKLSANTTSSDKIQCDSIFMS